MTSLSLRVEAKDLETCISCGLCLNDCPTYRIVGEEADSPRGRIQLIRAMVATEAAPDRSTVEHLEACLVCRACETACPSGVPFGRIMEGARAVLSDRGAHRASFIERLGLGLLSRPRALALLVTLADLHRRSGLARLARKLLPKRLAEMQALLRPREGGAYEPAERPAATALLFAGCVMRAGFGETERATERLLARSGHVVGAPEDQTCCGALHAHAGDLRGAQDLARRNLLAFAAGDAPVAVNAAGCGAHLRAYGELLAHDPAWAARAAAFAERVRDASQLVTSGSIGAPPPRPLRVVYQDACHLAHGQRVRREPRALLESIPGLTLVPIRDPEKCCGSAGTYNLTHPRIAAALRAEKVAAVLAAGPDLVVSGNPGCLMQIESGLREAGSAVPAVHILRLLDDPGCVAADTRARAPVVGE